MNQNRYVQLKFDGPLWKRLVKRVWLNLSSRPNRKQLGVDSYIRRPFSCSAPKLFTVGARCTIGRGLNVQLLTKWYEQQFSPKVTVGDDTYIGAGCEIVSVSGVHIGNGCTISDHVYINDSSHSFDPRDGLLMDRPLNTKGPISIGDGSFLGRNATVLPGVQIGRHCVVGAGSVVTRSAPDYSMVTGNPARIVARFNAETGHWDRVA